VPIYKKQPPLPGDTPVWRYLTLRAVFATIKTRQLRLTRVDTFQDPFEGSVPDKEIENQLPLFAGAASARMMMDSVAAHYPGMGRTFRPDEDPWVRMTRLRRTMTRSAHVSSWSAGNQSELLWRLYCTDGPPGVGVALRTTLARLEASVEAHDLYVSRISYINYREAPPFTDKLDPLMHKRDVFDTEQELRLLRFDEMHFDAQAPKGATVHELPEHVPVGWVLSDVVEEIVISPYADETYEDLVRHALNALDTNLADRVVLSELHERKHPPNF
jgi:hypothetical protein